ncbi:MAG: histidine phosphatase family protein [Gaiella sp.]
MARHGHAASNVRDVVSGRPPGEGLSALGVEQALALREQLAGEPIELGVATELRRTQETLDLALAGRAPTLVLPALNEIDFGRYEGGPLADYREWAWSTEPDVPCPGGGESRVALAARLADGLEQLLERAERLVLVVAHALPVRYVIDASDSLFPAARIEHVPHATPYTFTAQQVEAALDALRLWIEQPRFVDEDDEPCAGS